MFYLSFLIFNPESSPPHPWTFLLLQAASSDPNLHSCPCEKVGKIGKSEHVGIVSDSKFHRPLPPHSPDTDVNNTGLISDVVLSLFRFPVKLTQRGTSGVSSTKCIFNIQNGVLNSRNGIFNIQNGVLNSRNGISNIQNGILNSRNGISV